MITYLYWIAVILLALLALVGVGSYLGQWKAGLVVTAIVLIVGGGAYYFHFRQLFVKRLGGVMVITTPEGRQYMGATWKDEDLWVETYDPATNTCHFDERARRGILEGRVTIKDCNPMLGVR